MSDPIIDVVRKQREQEENQERTAVQEPIGTTASGLEIPSGDTLTVPAGITLMHWGALTINGTLTNNGTIVQYG